jgi:hypothetical protein
MTVIKSLCKNFGSPSALRGQLQKRQIAEFCLAEAVSQPEKFAGGYY